MARRIIVKSIGPKIPEGRNTTKNIPSLDSGTTGAVSSKPSLQYTGTNIIGIATMHKSNAVPVFTQEHAKDLSAMRR